MSMNLSVIMVVWSVLGFAAAPVSPVAAGQKPSRGAVIENAHLRVAVFPQSGSIAIRHMGTSRDFARIGLLAGRIEGAAAAREIADPVWGQGKEILIDHNAGWKTSLRLFRGQPFLHVHTTTHNGGSRPQAVAFLETLDFQVDLGKPADRLRSFGTGFLKPLGEAPGSFSFTSVVDPETRHVTQGIVDMLQEDWDPRSRTLSGRSGIVGGDPYEIRIALPARGSWEVSRMAADGAKIDAAGVSGQGVRVLIQSASTREVSWRVRF